MNLKPETLKSKKLRDSARGEECTLQIVGVCNGNSETTVLAHLNFTGSGMGMKASDLDACYACSSCHDVWDGRRKLYNLKTDGPCLGKSEYDFFTGDRSFYGGRAIVRTHIRMLEKGILKL